MGNIVSYVRKQGAQIFKPVLNGTTTVCTLLNSIQCDASGDHNDVKMTFAGEAIAELFFKRLVNEPQKWQCICGVKWLMNSMGYSNLDSHCDKLEEVQPNNSIPHFII